MALLEMGGRRFTLPQGEVLLGADPGSAIPLAFPGILPRHAKLRSLPDGQVVITKAVPEAEVLINGVRLGAEPTPLLHGDKVEVGGQELTFVDERRSGSTQYVQAMSVPQAMAQAKAEAKGGKVTVNTGGRVVSLTDGREYAIAGSSLVFGRDASCDVVVPGKDVSRRHAEIVQTPKGYLLVDSSTNGTSVNDVRVEGQRLLARADVITIGEEKFRFYADTAAQRPPPENPKPGPAAGAPAAAAPPPPPAVPPTKGESVKLRETVHGVPAAPRPSGVPLASFLVRGGALKGQRLTVKTPVVNIGRADYNDLVLPDESVSTTHAKLQRREGVWVLVDLDSTNGTFVDGDQIKGDAPLAPGATVRFGDVSLVFEPTDDAAEVAKGGSTRVMEVMTMSPPPPPPPPPPPAPPPLRNAPRRYRRIPRWRDPRRRDPRRRDQRRRNRRRQNRSRAQSSRLRRRRRARDAEAARLCSCSGSSDWCTGCLSRNHVHITSAGRTDVGVIRSGNEDSFRMIPDRGIFVVADGMGGHAAGEVASEMAVRIVADEIHSVRGLTDEQVAERMRGAIRTANGAIFQRTLTEHDKRGMGTTVTALTLYETRFLIGQVGDSRAYLLRDGRLSQLTKDHSYVQEQVDAGYLTPEQARTHPYSNVITRCVGANSDVMPDIYAGTVKPRDLFLLASDGLTGMLEDYQLSELLSPDRMPQDEVDALIAEANRHGGLDNITAIIVRIDSVEAPAQENVTTQQTAARPR